MNKVLLSAVALLGTAALFSSCSKDEETKKEPYTIPTTYNFSDANYVKSAQLAKMAVELDSYLKKANVGSTTVSLDQTVVNNMFVNQNSPFSDAILNTSSFSINAIIADAAIYKAYVDSVLIFNNGTAATDGVGGFVPRAANKIIVGPTGLEYGQVYTKGTMGALFFKEAVRLLTDVKSIPVGDKAAAQTAWDEAFGYLAVPVNYDTAVTYASTDPNKPLLWGGYLAERGKAIQAGGVIFNAFLKGRAAIGGNDLNVRNEQADIIINKWEQLAAAAALAYVTAPTASAAIGNYGTQLHALSEGFGFIASLKYRAASSKLSATDFETLNTIIHKNFYTLLSQTGFTDLVTAQNILKATYGLN